MGFPFTPHPRETTILSKHFGEAEARTLDGWKARGGYRALEGNFRPPGGFTTDMMNYACDIDIYDLWSKVITGAPTADFKYERKQFCAHVARRFGRVYKYAHDYVMKELGSALIVFREVPPVFAGAMGDWMTFIVILHGVFPSAARSALVLRGMGCPASTNSIETELRQ